MSPTVESIESEALRLGEADRVRLVERLITSLDLDPDVEDAWSDEVERRDRDLANGSVTLVSGPEALEALRAELE